MKKAVREENKPGKKSVNDRLGSLKSEITKEKTRSVLRALLTFEKELFFTTLLGVRSFALEIRKPFQVILGHLSLVQLAFLGFCLGGLVVGLLPWIQYRVVFQSEEIVNLGSAARVLFVLPALAGIVLSAVDVSRRRLILLILCALAALGFIAGLIFPNPIHTSIVSGAFQIRWVAYVYVPFLALIAYFSEQAFEKTTFPAAEMLRSILEADRPAPAGITPVRPRSGRAG